MLIRLLPAPSQPTVLFKLNFEDLSESLQIPPAWSNQLSALALDDLEAPNLFHALDKAVGIQCILEEVVFDLVKSRVRCLFVDGEVEEWPIDDGNGSQRGCDCCCGKRPGLLGCGSCRRPASLTERLESVLDDVNESAKEVEREKQLEQTERLREEEDEAEREHHRNKMEDQPVVSPKAWFLNSSPGGVKGSLKKHRSLLMNLVASLMPSNVASAPTEVIRHRSRSPKRSASLPNTRPSSPSSDRSTGPGISPSESPTDAEDLPSSSSWSSWTSLTRTVSNPMSRKGSWGRRNKLGHKFKSKSISEAPVSPLRGSETATDSDGADNLPLVSSPTSTSPVNELSRRSKPRPVSMCSLPVLSTSVAKDDRLIIIAPPPPPRLSARALRRRARATLVDTFRLCVLPEVGKRVRGVPLLPASTSSLIESPGWRSSVTGVTTYYNWAIGSMIKCVKKRLAEVIEEAEECCKDAGVDSSAASQPAQNAASLHSEGGTLTGSGSVSVFMTATEETETAISTFTSTIYESFDDSEDHSASDTDTDGSLLHTPAPLSPVLGGTGTVAYFGVKQGELEAVNMLPPPIATAPEEQRSTTTAHLSPSVDDPPAYSVTPSIPSQEGPLPLFPSSALSIPEPVSQVLGALYTNYNALVQLHAHLTELLAISKEREREALDEARSREEVLEVRCRRRAWLGRGWGLHRPSLTAKCLGHASPPPAPWRVLNHGNGNGLVVPFKPSGLGKYSWSAQDWEYDPWYCFPEYCPDPNGHKHQRYHSFSRSANSCYEDIEDDDSSSTTSSFTGSGYQYQHSGAPYEEPSRSHSHMGYSPHAKIRRSLEGSSLVPYDETIPVACSLSPVEDGYLPDPYGPDLYGLPGGPEDALDIGGPTAMEVEMRLGIMDDMVDIALENSANATGDDGLLLMECYSNPFEGEGEDQHDLTEQFFEFSQPLPRHHTVPEPEMEKDRLESQQLPRRSSAPALGRPQRKTTSKSPRSRKISAGSINDMKLFFPVTEEEDAEGGVAHQEDVDVSIKFDVYAINTVETPAKPGDGNTPAPTRTRTRKDSMKPSKPLSISDLGMGDISPPYSPTSCSPTSPTSARPQKPLSTMHVPKSPPSPTSEQSDFTLAMSQSKTTLGWIPIPEIRLDGESTSTSAQVVGVAI
uniref:Uncharacterized protein n=1 Tax=Moniliophthora roreri TaxID=221103 RepID=A0A0W0F0T7_MONRR